MFIVDYVWNRIRGHNILVKGKKIEVVFLKFWLFASRVALMSIHSYWIKCNIPHFVDGDCLIVY